MAVKKSGRKPASKKSAHKQRGDSKTSESESEARLTPPEEKNGARRPPPQANQNSNTDNGKLAVNTGELKLPQELADEEEDERKTIFTRIDPAVLTILCLSLLFIAFIACVILYGWEPPTTEIKMAK
jgi:hypothetical protein